MSSCILKKQNLTFYKKRFEKLKYTEEATVAAKKILFLLEEKNSPHNMSTKYLLYLSKYSKNYDDKIFYQEKLAKIYFKSSTQINSAIQIWFNLISGSKSHKKNQYKFLIAKGYFKIKKYNQALLELNSIKTITKKVSLPIQLLKIKIFKELKFWKKSIALYKKIKKTFYIEYKKQEMAMDLISIYKHLSLHNLALRELKDLKTYHSSPNFIQRRISVVKKRIKNQPKIRR
ncbi:MAG: hypothetical protein HAW60_00050 [Bdellovibrionales bacterium]|nr:hypothetical protein [Bdellovibrionales bacterium]